MAKIRVYEFARELNMTNRELLDKIRDLDIDVNSHMSSLDEDVVATIKSVLFGEKDDQLEEKRVRPTVIRRRKVVAPPEAGDPRDASAAEARRRKNRNPPRLRKRKAEAAAEQVEETVPDEKAPVAKNPSRPHPPKSFPNPNRRNPTCHLSRIPWKPELMEPDTGHEAAEPNAGVWAGIDAQTADESTPVDKSATPPAKLDAAADIDAPCRLGRKTGDGR
jgi:translation initiation factor IF-2